MMEIQAIWHKAQVYIWVLMRGMRLINQHAAPTDRKLFLTNLSLTKIELFILRIIFYRQMRSML